MFNYPAVSLALLWFILRLALHYTSWFEDELTVSVMINLFLLVMLIYKSIRDTDAATLPFIEVAKAGMRQASLYAFLVAIFIFIFYQFIDPDFIADGVDRMQQARIEEVGESDWDTVKSENPTIEADTMEEFLAEEKQTMMDLFSPWFIASTSLFVMVIGGLIYSFVATAFHRQVLKSLKK